MLKTQYTEERGSGATFHDPMWWVWLITVAMLVAGLAGITTGFVAAIALSAAQTLYFWRKTGNLPSVAVQIRLNYTLLLAICFVPTMRWGYVLPAMGTSALLLFDYCLMARMLSLLPWNRTAAMSWSLVRRTFFSAPVARRIGQRSTCGELNGVCELEIHAAQPR